MKTCTATHPLGFTCTLEEGHEGRHRCVYDYAHLCVTCGQKSKACACSSLRATGGPNHPTDQARGHQ